MAQPEQRAIALQRTRVLRARDLGPVEACRLERGARVRIGDQSARCGRREALETRELPAPALAHCRGEFVAEIAEERERARSAPFLAHEEHRYLGQQQAAGVDRAHRLGCGQRVQALAERAVADLVVVLREGDERDRRGILARLAARAAAVAHDLALVCEPLGQRTSEAIGIAVVVRVVALRLARGGHMQHMMHVVVPLRRVLHRLAIGIAREPGRFIVLVLEHQVDLTARHAFAHAVRELGQQVRIAIVSQRVHRVQPQPIEVEVLDPLQRVAHDELAHRTAARAVEVDRRTPWREMPVGECLGCECVHIGTLGPEVVVDHVEQHHQSARMGGVDEGLQIRRATIGGVRRIRTHTVVSPAPLARERRDRHQLDRGDSQCHQMGEPLDRPSESAFWREAPDVQFVDHGLVPWPAAPVGVMPAIRAKVDDLARRMHAIGLEARGGIG